MKTISLLITFLVGTLISQAQDLTVTVDNVSSTEGKVIFSLHTNMTFMNGAGIQNLESKIVDGKVTVTFKDVDPGTYAIMVLHDKNENNRMDFYDDGLPKESYGMSNNPTHYGPPKFTNAKFEMASENIHLNIRF
ncbi:MAG: DUF2141 domain-containing protein [Bacteroidia bacterium]|nr:DUF2141 domain-containing protein [Bacteroidia bacterium]NND24670.1 DUF2141 domain-containing protein [Flavobacteriaceae bacterium]NNK59012.1 DUF2141 domain-containing protein [Flavobacteriaceae bacterium]NNL32568.1 DUF2141 domain-containing protein [Flavobacteriaceae bacterium]